MGAGMNTVKRFYDSKGKLTTSGKAARMEIFNLAKDGSVISVEYYKVGEPKISKMFSRVRSSLARPSLTSRSSMGSS
jgi:hypothetical protein